MIKVLLDTNILLDYMVPDRPGSDSAMVIIDAASYGFVELTVSAGSLKDAYYIARKHYSDELVRNYLEAFMDLMRVEPLDQSVCTAALKSDEPDFEDGIVRAIAELANVDWIVTRDADAFANARVKSIDPAVFAEVIQSN